MDVKIKLSDVTKQYDFHKSKADKLKSFFSFRTKTLAPKFWALRGVSLTVEAGESIGLIGVNGSGKSTLSNIIAGVIPQTTGAVMVNGETSIISIGAGLKWELTGKENIVLKLLMSGLKNQEINELMDDIIAFSELGELISQPVKSYSSGMKSRLGFSIAVYTNPDIIVIDEALSVGDETFYQKCVNRMMAFKEQGKTIVFVSHSLGQIEKLCDKAAWIHHGELKEYGATKAVVDAYKTYTHWYKGLAQEEKNKYLETKKTERMQFVPDDQVASHINEKQSNYYNGSKLEVMSKPHLLMIVGSLALLVMLFYIHIISFTPEVDCYETGTDCYEIEIGMDLR